MGAGVAARTVAPGAMSTLPPLVFVVDGDEHERNALCRLLRSHGYFVQGFESASAFRRSADLTQAPACVLLDLRLAHSWKLDVPDLLDQGLIDRPEVQVSYRTGKLDVSGTWSTPAETPHESFACPGRTLRLGCAYLVSDRRVCFGLR